MKRLILIGYWRNEDDPDWPDPARFVDHAWEPEVRARVSEYLKTGRVLRRFSGASWCRFHCPQFGKFGLGSIELTDGVYLWPNGLSHYLEEHAVRLPQVFVEHVLRRSTQPTLWESVLRWLAGESGPGCDGAWWRTQTGFTAGESFLSPAD